MNSRPHLLAILPDFVPSTFICVMRPLIQLHRAGEIRARILPEFLTHRGSVEWADLVVFCRNTEPEYDYLLDFIVNRGIPYIYDLDDNFFELPLESNMGRYHRRPDRLAMLCRYLQSAELVRVYSEPLLDRVKTINPKVEKFLAPVDLSLIPTPRNRFGREPIKIIYATSRIEDDTVGVIESALMRILKRYDRRVEFHFWGWNANKLSSFPGVHHHPFVLNYERFLKKFSRSGFDIGLAPLTDDPFHRSKTDNKFREYGASAIAGIYSRVGVYSACVVDGETGLLVRNDPDLWYGAMARLIEDPVLRERIKRQARSYVQRHYSQELFVKAWQKQIEYLIQARQSRSLSGTGPVFSPEIGPKEELDQPFRRPRAPEKWNGALNFYNLSKLITRLRENGISDITRIGKRLVFLKWTTLKLYCLTSPVLDLLSPPRAHDKDTRMRS